MMDNLLTGMPWFLVSVLALGLGVVFVYYYFRTKDEIKVVFSSAYIFSSLVFLTHINPAWKSSWILENLHIWGALPIISAVLLVSLTALIDFTRRTVMKLYISSILFTIFAIITSIPFPSELIFQSMALITISFAVFLFTKRKTNLGLMFLLSVLCFSVAGVSVSLDLDALFISTCYVFGFIFTTFALEKSYPTHEKGFQSFFNLKSQLEKAQVELESSKNRLETISAKFNTLLKLIADPVVIVDGKGVFLELNDAVEERTGFTRDELLGTNFLKTKMITTKSKALLIKNLAKRMMGIKIEPYEIEVNTKSGEKLLVELNAKKIEYEGTPADLVVFRDVTERKRVNEELMESEERYKCLCEDAMALMLKSDPKGNITYTNRIIEEYNLQKEDLIGKNMRHFVPRKYWLKLLDVRKKVNSGKKLTGEIALKTPKGEITVEFRARPIFEEKKVVGTLTIIRDITERKEIEKKLEKYTEELEKEVKKRTKDLAESEEKIRSVFESSPNAITVTDSNGTITDCTQATLDIHGFSLKNELIGKNSMELISEQDRDMVSKILAKTLENGSVKSIECRLLKKDRKKFYGEVSVGILRDSEQVPIGYVAISSDITKRKKAEEKLKDYSDHLEDMVEERTKQLKQSERMATIGELATMVAHDLRNPLQGIAGATYYLKKANKTLINDPNVEKMFEVIDSDLKYSDKIVSDLLDYSREINLDFSLSTAKKMIENSLFMIEVPENIKVFNFTQEVPNIKVDVEKMTRVFINLTKNAIDAMPEGGRMTFEQSVTNNNLKIIVNDTGSGISQESLKNLWKPLFTTKAKGMGFGLTICKRIIEAHGGTISVDSQVGVGTTFTVVIPINLIKSGDEKEWLKMKKSS